MDKSYVVVSTTVANNEDADRIAGTLVQEESVFLPTTMR